MCTWPISMYSVTMNFVCTKNVLQIKINCLPFCLSVSHPRMNSTSKEYMRGSGKLLGSCPLVYLLTRKPDENCERAVGGRGELGKPFIGVNVKNNVCALRDRFMMSLSCVLDVLSPNRIRRQTQLYDQNSVISHGRH